MKGGNSVLSAYGVTIFEVMSRLAQKEGAVNLGQGFPEGLEPANIIERAAQEMLKGPHQYPSMLGLPELRERVAAHDKRFYGLDFDPQTEVLVTAGATEALAATLLGLIEPGDEVVLIEPLYDSYLPIIRRGGGIPKVVRMEPPSWELPKEELAKAFGPKTKAILLNSPGNPSAKVFNRDELEFIAGLVKKHNAYAICDEVYEHLIFDGLPHIPLITLPGMFERCVKIGSAGKTFSLTAWKVGYISACKELMTPITRAHQFLNYTVVPYTQKAVAFGLGQGDEYYQGLAADMQQRRDMLGKGLAEIGFAVVPCQGSYFISADFRPLGFKGDDKEFCQYLTCEVKVAAIPVSAFYQAGDVRHFVRFCFAKKEEAINQALDNMRAKLCRKS